MKVHIITAALLASPVALAYPAHAAPGDPVKVGGGLTLDPILDARLRHEHVDQPTTEADALTVRVRAGLEVKHASGLSLLAESEGTLAVINDYNAFPFAIADSQRRPRYSVVADPANIELNRLQLQYKARAGALTVGRQRLNIDDQRFVGSVGWRQNEQTFDAVRGEATLGPVALDATYAIAQRTIFGIDGGPRTAYDGDFVFLGAGTKLGSVQIKAFAYLLDYDLNEQGGALAMSNADTQTYGIRITGAWPLSPGVKLNVAASYARQADWQDNPQDYAADYLAAELGLTHGALGLTAGYEKLGSDAASSGALRAFQTPMATLHKFNGWADLFLTTPATGLEDWYLGASYKFTRVKALPGLNASATWHRFDSDTGGSRYGDEWDASLGFKRGRVAVLAKFAEFDAHAAGFAHTRKFWLQAEIAY